MCYFTLNIAKYRLFWKDLLILRKLQNPFYFNSMIFSAFGTPYLILFPEMVY